MEYKIIVYTSLVISILHITITSKNASNTFMTSQVWIFRNDNQFWTLINSKNFTVEWN